MMMELDKSIEIDTTYDEESNNITFLYNNIKEILVNKIKEKNPSYEYKSINDLKSDNMKYLPKSFQNYANCLYMLVKYPKDMDLELTSLQYIYNKIEK